MGCETAAVGADWRLKGVRNASQNMAEAVAAMTAAHDPAARRLH